MRMMFRIKDIDTQRGFRRYFWKAAPIEQTGGHEMATGIRDKVAILGMGCSKFGERWDSDAADLMVEAFAEGDQGAGIETKQIDAAWLATAIEEQHVGKSAVPLATALRLPFIPVTRVENFCASGTEAFRGAVYAVASGAADIALALGVEKLKDTGYGGLPQRGRGTLNNMIWPNLSAPGLFAQLGAAYRAKHGASRDDSSARWRISRSRATTMAARNPKAHLRNRITDGRGAECADGRRAARPVRLLRRERRRRLRHRHDAGNRPLPRQDAIIVSVKALQLSVSNGLEAQHNSWDGSYFHTTRDRRHAAPIRKRASRSRATRST